MTRLLTRWNETRRSRAIGVSPAIVAFLVVITATRPGAGEESRPGGIGPALVGIPVGIHDVGDPQGRYDEPAWIRVKIGGFHIEETEVTNLQYSRFVEEAGYRPEGPWGRGFKTPEAAARPVRFVTWYDAQAYATWAGRRLPLAAEWEVAAGPHRYPWGPVWMPRRAVLNRSVESGPDPVGTASDVTPRGVRGMAGNVREWTADWYDPTGPRSWERGSLRPDPRGPADGTPPEERFREAGTATFKERSTRKEVRGGSWVSRGRDHARRSRRHAHAPWEWFDDVGFRCVISDTEGSP